MTGNDIFTIFGIGGGAVIVVILGLVKVKPLEISVWSWLLRKFGKAINGETNDRLDMIEKSLTEHLDAEDKKDALQNRTMILRFADEMFEKKYHSREHFEEILERIDRYEKYCSEHPNFKNGRTESSERIIRDQYEECMRRHDFKMEAS